MVVLTKAKRQKVNLNGVRYASRVVPVLYAAGSRRPVPYRVEGRTILINGRLRRAGREKAWHDAMAGLLVRDFAVELPRIIPTCGPASTRFLTFAPMISDLMTARLGRPGAAREPR